MLCLGIVTHLPDSTMGDRKCRDKVASMENLLSQLPSEHVPLGGGSQQHLKLTTPKTELNTL